MERYKGYKVPISNVKMGNLLDKLNAMDGTTLADVIEGAAASQKAAAASGDSSAATETTSPADLLAALDQAIGLNDTDPEDVSTSEGSSVEEPKKQRKRRNSRNLLLDEITGPRANNGTVEENKVQSNFIDLTRLLPPLPKKGSFEVSTIKKSLYFFS